MSEQNRMRGSLLARDEYHGSLEARCKAQAAELTRLRESNARLLAIVKAAADIGEGLSFDEYVKLHGVSEYDLPNVARAAIEQNKP